MHSVKILTGQFLLFHAFTSVLYLNPLRFPFPPRPPCSSRMVCKTVAIRKQSHKDMPEVDYTKHHPPPPACNLPLPYSPSSSPNTISMPATGMLSVLHLATTLGHVLQMVVLPCRGLCHTKGKQAQLTARVGGPWIHSRSPFSLLFTVRQPFKEVSLVQGRIHPEALWPALRLLLADL